MATGKTKGSVKYEDIISKSLLVRSGSPAVYQLRPKKEEIGSLRRTTLGEKDVNQTNRTVLLVGETGTGKSTLINTLVNYTMGVKWEDDVWFQIVEEERNQSESQTSDVIVYQIFGFEGKTLPYSLTIIDTPGYGDTRGIELDIIISERLLDWFRSDDGVHEINAVGLVLKATENRLSDRLMYIFDSVVSLFGKDMEQNIVALITHSSGPTYKNALKALEAANIKCAKDEKNQPVHFLFNNCQQEDRTEDTEEHENIFTETTGGLKKFTDFLEQTKPQQLNTAVEVLKSRIRLTACIQNLKERIRLTELRQREIQQTQEALKKHEEEMKNDENFTVEVDEEYKEKQAINKGYFGFFYEGATCCTVCEENCHHPGCTMAPSPENCEVMKGGRCTSCTRKCPVSDHVKEDKIYVTKTRRVKKTLQDVKEKYENEKSECDKTTSLLEKLQKELKELEKEKDQMLNESFHHVVNLQQIALKVDSLSTHVHLDFLIEKMKEKGDTEKIQKLEEMKRRVDERTRAAAAGEEEMKTKGSVKYEDIILKSLLVRSGSPAVYQLRPKKEEIGSLRRMTLGEKDLNQTNRTVLLVGETGTGKSALINSLVNYTMGVKWEDDVWFQIVEEERNQSESQTSDVIVYQIFGSEGKTLPYSLTIIDTPGYGHTRGIEHDVIISERLLDWFRSDDGVHEINAVGLVLKATENRLSDRLMYIFDLVVSLFGKDMEQNIVALITHSSGPTYKNALKALEAANIKCAKDEKNQPVHFLFNNCQHNDRTEDTEEHENIFTETTGGLKKFTDFLEQTKPQQLKTAVEVLKSRIRLTACIQNLKERIQSTELKQREIQQTQEALKKHEEEMKNNEKFTVEVDEEYKEKQAINKGYFGFLYEGATCCTVCEENCHHPGCTMAPSPENCEVMKDGRCTSCTRKCPVSDHVKDGWIYVTKTRRVTKTLQDLKEKYEKEKSDFESLLLNLQQEMKELEKEKDQMLNESFHHVVNLQQIALKVDSLSIHVHLDFLIEKMKEKGDTEKIQKLEEMKRRVDERTRAAAAGEEEMKTKGSVKYEDIISKSLPVRSGSPAVYQLRPKKEKIGSLRRTTLGEKDLNQTNRTILLVGGTGTGKSALINTLVNYTMGVEWEDDVWFQIVEEKKRNQSESQTSDVIVYQIFGFEGKTLPYSLTIIDTPGYGDIRGIQRDIIISERLLDWFRSDDGVHEINAVGLVLKATENRLDDRLMYIFDSVVSLFGKDMEQNIVALITHSDGLTPENALKALEAANIKCAKDEKNQPVHFLFNNCQQADRTEDAEELQHAFTETTKGLKKFTDFLEKTKPQQLKTTVEVLKSRIRLTACIQNLKEKIQSTELKQTEIQQTKEALKKHEEEMKNDEKFTVEVDEIYKEKKTIRARKWLFEFFYEGAVCCTVCEENCHHPGCTMAPSPKDCAVMKDGRCTSCTRKCPVSDHVKENWIYVTKTRRVKKTLRDLKGTYENQKSECDKKTTLLEKLQKEMEELEKEKDQMLDESFQHVVNLQQIALKVDSLSTLVHLDFLIEKMKEKGDTEKIQKLEEMKRRVDERTRAALRYRQTAAGEEVKK